MSKPFTDEQLRDMSDELKTIANDAVDKMHRMNLNLIKQLRNERAAHLETRKEHEDQITKLERSRDSYAYDYHKLTKYSEEERDVARRLLHECELILKHPEAHLTVIFTQTIKEYHAVLSEMNE